MKKEISIHAACAKEIRKELKSKFPTTKFSITSDSYSGGNSVRIEWEDGHTCESVENIVEKYQLGRFDGMTDSYTYDNRMSDIPQVKYVQFQRLFSENIYD